MLRPCDYRALRHGKIKIGREQDAGEVVAGRRSAVTGTRKQMARGPIMMAAAG